MRYENSVSFFFFSLECSSAQTLAKWKISFIANNHINGLEKVFLNLV